jgi:hypothetical protein
MRLVILAAALSLLFFADPAAAQKPGASQQALDASPQRLEASRQTLNAMVIDNGLLNDLVLEAFRTNMPEYQRSVSSAPFYADLTAPRRRAIDAYVTNLGPVLSEEVMRMSPILLDTYAPRLAAIFNEDELRDIRTYMQSPAGASLFRRAALAGARRETATDFTIEELAGEAAFSTTVGGRAWQAHVNEFNSLLHDLGYQAVSQTAPTFQARVFREICALAEEQCPPELRAAGQAI